MAHDQLSYVHKDTETVRPSLPEKKIGGNRFFAEQHSDTLTKKALVPNTPVSQSD